VALVRLLAAVACIGVATGVASAAPQSTSRIVDRTVLCKTWGAGYPDPLRVLTVVADSGYAQTTNGPQGSPKFVVAQVATGVNGQDQVVISQAACKPASRIPLTGKGLKSGATIFGNKWQCPVAATVLIRVRAAFRSPVAMQTAPDAFYLSIAQGKHRGGAIAVATRSKAPISYATVGPKGASSIAVAKPRCQRVKK
jgi:hypothetical protein